MATYTTRFNIDDHIWILGNRKAVECRIVTVCIMERKYSLEMGYECVLCNGCRGTFCVEEKDAFTTKEELIESLQKEE